MKQRLMTIAFATAALIGGSAVLAQETEEAGDVAVQEMTIGAEDAPVEIIEYASYTCPHCATFHDTVFEELRKDYIETGKVKFTYREVYFDRYSLWGSLVARCGGEEKFFGITDMIYDQQSDWTRAGSEAEIAEALRKIGRIAGIENDTLEACLSDGEKARSLVEWYQANAEEHNITATPSFVIDGETYSNMGYSEFQEILDEQLSN
ncbi:DsbA family protein [Marivita sp. GX14005]|uniref:DsbA family protein n=1 Tax=Marivita sp. GX14005 TaxID=2942276 RepID=UPI0020195C00|nr:DsbA family protein [Marivita sp. GX14005]MCL3881469.1 DsbA family protein [Marivita sp. GX14005]